jgi:hypothetical protein
MALTHNEAWAGDSVFGVRHPAQHRLVPHWVAKKWKNNLPTGVPLHLTRSAIIRMCNIRSLQGKDKAKHPLQNPSLFVTFAQKTSKSSAKTPFFCTFCHAVAVSSEGRTARLRSPSDALEIRRPVDLFGTVPDSIVRNPG